MKPDDIAWLNSITSNMENTAMSADSLILDNAEKALKELLVMVDLWKGATKPLISIVKGHWEEGAESPSLMTILMVTTLVINQFREDVGALEYFLPHLITTIRNELNKQEGSRNGR